MSEPRSRGGAVAIGGGTGLPVVLRCLVDLGYETSAVVTMADDGGSSGTLRAELGMLPPGDVRNCLVALGDPGSSLGELFQYRFGRGEGLAGHALGNLVIAALVEMTGSFTAAIEEAGRLLGVRGRVLPSTLEDISLHATDIAGNPISGQSRIATNGKPVAHVRLEPERPEAYPPAAEAIRKAELVVIGPGSLFTSLIPNLLVPGIADALRASSATCVYICNVANQRGETVGMGAADHVEALLVHGFENLLDAVVVQAGGVTPERPGRYLVYDDGCSDVETVQVDAEDVDRIEARGVRVIAADVIDPADHRRHSGHKLCRVLGGLSG